MWPKKIKIYAPLVEIDDFDEPDVTTDFDTPELDDFNTTEEPDIMTADEFEVEGSDEDIA